MIWLFMAVWMTGTPPHDYKVVAKVGPFTTYEQCWSAGVLSANAIQSKDDVSNALGACVREIPVIGIIGPGFMEYKGMWGMVCASLDKPDLCWLKDGRFVDPLGDPR